MIQTRVDVFHDGEAFTYDGELFELSKSGKYNLIDLESIDEELDNYHQVVHVVNKTNEVVSKCESREVNWYFDNLYETVDDYQDFLNEFDEFYTNINMMDVFTVDSVAHALIEGDIL